ncbi:peptide chain release factor 2 [bacterium (Candidatus Gribaldobacteria) CG_4_9_14_3_um_filter_36_15]|uniref:Peptide chain release factor 2 n=3 Tax=Candidatus Gribaldobacteria TaxID=2798536 RepID=A0A2M7VJQ4_9BACT|nr:MAG: peptide chain release factor 2 [Parcubacteria group bacterium CG2_30_36_38]PIR91087.1 MAG: peptide chain release factor 2 [bacterium (Candidatus Gribaldobacteria) CG10_big_fil_rev_8_21_14_0_10_37_46]PJA02081.1 MAG: peptide chain release factor 2 [bacterium (Candidatus Gribaldobacteria) CG_4_10_14_0_2_um_filter_36_18]PJB09101.1 MAG: peptide chain release factor 2 [bacterium (Candidatus Gribaldobacteria) CG_4_9_14_3_um_filter_36_15]
MNELQGKIENLEAQFLDLSDHFDLNKKKKEIKALKEQTNKPDFWQDQKKAAEISQRIALLETDIKNLEDLKKEIQDLKEISKFVEENSREFKELEKNYKGLREKIKEEEKKVFLSGHYDKLPAILTIQAGAGGRDAEDWAVMLLRMYRKYCQLQELKTKILARNFGEGGGPEGRIGIKEVSMEIKGNYTYGFLKNEQGIHRLVRISPFSAQALRHTSFAKVEVLPEIPESDISKIKIKPEDLKIETFGASGPGGQYVNKRESAVRITHLPTGLKASSQEERLQGLNRKKAMQILAAKLFRLSQQEKEKEIQKVKGKKISASWGNQRRSYILHPYKLCKDIQTGVETTNVEAVLDGNLDKFIQAEIKL